MGHSCLQLSFSIPGVVCSWVVLTWRGSIHHLHPNPHAMRPSLLGR
jgi:hypothetical protein